MPEALSELSATAIAAQIGAGELTSEEVVSACLARIAEREGDVHAWVHIDADAALAAARQCDSEPARGPLHGVPVGVKDLIDTADAPTAYGSPIYADHRPADDAVCVRRLRDAGAVILGKTVTTEFALFHPGPTANPHDLTRTPGGSSSGSAAAVADHMVPLALGTQTAGSIVRPASFCGIYGFKPTFAVIPTDGVKAIGPSLDTLGPLARTVDDLVLTAAMMADDPELAQMDGGQPSIAFARTYEWDRAEPATRDALTDVADRLDLPRVDLPAAFADLVAAQILIMDAEAAAALDREYRTHPELLSDQLRETLERGRAIGSDELHDAHALADRCRAELPAVFAAHDVLVVPSVIGEAPVGQETTGDPLFCRLWTLLGAPSVAIPGLLGPDGMPVGLQVVAALHRDSDALTAARWIGQQLSEETVT